jgi:hypothetical protein
MDNSNLDLSAFGKKVPAKRQPRRTELECTHDRAILANIKLRNPGATAAELAELLYDEAGTRLAPRTINDELKIIKKTWIASMVGDYNQLKSKELARLDVLEQEAWDAWNQSKSDFVREVIEHARRRGGGEPKVSIIGDLVASIITALAEQEAYLHEEVVEAIVEDAIQQAIQESLDQGEDGETFINKIIQTTESRVGDVRFLRSIHEVQRDRRKILGVYAPELHQMDIRKFEVKGYIGWSPDTWKQVGGPQIVEGQVADE